MMIFDQLKKNEPHLRVLTVSVLAGMLVLLAGLWWVQVISCRHYSENLRAQAFRTVRIPAIRGKILDRNGGVLAENQPQYVLGLYLDELRDRFQAEWARSRPRVTVTNRLPAWKRWLGFNPVSTVRVKLSKQEYMAHAAQTRYRAVSNLVHGLSRSLNQPLAVSYGEFVSHYTEQLALPLPLTNCDHRIMARFFEQTSSPRGLDLDVHPQRSYPHGPTAAHVLGFLVRDNRSASDELAFFNYRLPDYRGRVGIEGLYDGHLRGKAGVKSVLVNSLGYRQSEQIWSEAEPGLNVVLTLDLIIQKAAEDALRSRGPDARGAAVVMEVRTGNLLALASVPAFDPNVFTQGVSHDYMNWLNTPKLRPQINRTMQENYAPGSIFKIAIALACLEAGIDPRQKIYHPGYIYVGRRQIDDLAPAGEYDFHRGFIHSSNAYFVTNGLRAGIERIVRIGQKLHLGQRTGLLPGQETPGYLPGLNEIRTGWIPGDTANICMGQGRLSVTPLQMAVMTAAIANGGKVLWPRLVDRIEPQRLHTPDQVERYPVRPPRDTLGVSPRTLALVREAMRADVEDEGGTGRLAFVPGLRVCGKTGTAQITNARNELVGNTLWFTSFAPFEQPRYAVLIMVETETGGYGGMVCAPMAKKIYETILELERQQGAVLARTP
ncbi:MAG: hypothetical protein JXQ71_15115 [Verrucomicrobia bacterium]|nr:hypothetical protein [Verrucomicrobiota bacterium]